MRSGRWKRHEREVARLFGTERNPSDGLPHTDAHSDEFAIEHKLRRVLPVLVTRGMAQAVADARGRIPLLVLTQPQIGRKPLRYVVIRMEDFLEESSDEATGAVVSALDADPSGQ